MDSRRTVPSCAFALLLFKGKGGDASAPPGMGSEAGKHRPGFHPYMKSKQPRLKHKTVKLEPNEELRLIIGKTILRVHIVSVRTIFTTTPPYRSPRAAALRK